MKKIFKGQEPLSLATHRRVNNTDYDGFREKQELREALVTEQRGICCYCMQRIKPLELTMKIEHFQSRSGYPSERLVYNNLFGACLGNEKAEAESHCDTFKGSKEFHFHMCNSGSIHTEIKYKTDGEIYSDNEDLNFELGADIDENEKNERKFKPGILNLNTINLIRDRKKTLDGFKDYLVRYKKGKLSKDKVIRLRNKWLGNSHADLLEPYCMIVVYYLEKKIATSKQAGK